MRMIYSTVFASLIMVLLSGPSHAQSWSVFRNCNTRPCIIGVAVSTWYQPGWSRTATYSNQGLAWQRACWLHFNDRGHRSPDIAAGRINCRKYR
jgi:hypothetical protein